MFTCTVVTVWLVTVWYRYTGFALAGRSLCYVNERVGGNDTQTMGREAHQPQYYFGLALPGARGGM